MAFAPAYFSLRLCIRVKALLHPLHIQGRLDLSAQFLYFRGLPSVAVSDIEGPPVSEGRAVQDSSQCLYDIL